MAWWQHHTLPALYFNIYDSVNSMAQRLPAAKPCAKSSSGAAAGRP